MKTDETFEEWYRYQIEKASGELTYGRHSDTEHIKRTYINRIHCVREAWNHQQKKLQDLEAKLAKAFKALEFYGDRRSWKAHNKFKYSDIVDKDIDHANRLHQCGGLKARQTLAEISDKGEGE